MEIDIRQKLEIALARGEAEERDVVYILVQIGKLIELTKSHAQYQALCFWRNMVVHSSLEKQTPFVTELKRRFKNIHVVGGVLAFGFVSGIELQNELIRFYHQQVQKDLLPNRDFLNRFRESLQRVVTDIPLLLRTEDGEIRLIFEETGDLRIEGPGTFRGTMTVLR